LSYARLVKDEGGRMKDEKIISALLS